MTNNQDDDSTRTHVVLTKGTMVSHYRIVEKIGAGGMGEVYLAEDRELDRKVALKFLPGHLSQDQASRARFKREAQAVAKLNHPNVITIYEVSEHKGRPFFAMELIEGQSLKELSGSKEPSIDRIIELALQVCEGLQEAHSAGIVHRDVKPGNIVIDKKGRLRLLDFGLAAIENQEHLTKTGSTLGTVRYMSPEQVRGEVVDSRSDLFSLGVILFELITGRLPFDGATDAAVLNSIVTTDPEPLSRFKSGISDDFQRIVSKLLEKDAGLRYQTASGVISDLRRLSPAGARPGQASSSDWWNRYVVVGAASVLVLVAVYWLVFRDAVEPPSGVSEGRKMLAVLPFENLGSPEDEYFADGITEEIIARLAAVKSVGIIARTSIMQYKGTEKTISQIGEELGVDYLLEGTVRWQKSKDGPDRVRVTPQLIRVSDATHLWAEIYDRVLDEVFAVQTEIGVKVVLALDLTLGLTERNHLTRVPTENLEAYDYYLRGNEYFNIPIFFDRKNLLAAAQLYRKAVEIDNKFVVAMAKLARTYVELYWHQDKQEDLLRRADSTLQHARRIDADLPELHLAQGSYYYHEGSFNLALDEFARALRVQPQNAEIIAEIGYVQRRQGRFEEAVTSLRKALELDPKSHVYSGILGDTYVQMRRYDDAEKMLKKSITLRPEMADNYVFLADLQLKRNGDKKAALAILHIIDSMNLPMPVTEMLRGEIEMICGRYEQALNHLQSDDPTMPGSAYYMRGLLYKVMNEADMAGLMFDSALGVLESKIKDYPDDIFVRSGLALTYAGLGRYRDAIVMADNLRSEKPLIEDFIYDYQAAINLATAYAWAGEPLIAIDLLDTLLTVPSFFSVPRARLSPVWKSLRDNPAFEEMLKKHE